MDRKIHAGMDRPIHCPACRGWKTIAPMASSTQERFRRETLPLSPPARSESGSPLMVYIPPPAPVALTDLLESFRSALQVGDKLSPVLTVKAGDVSKAGKTASSQVVTPPGLHSRWPTLHLPTLPIAVGPHAPADGTCSSIFVSQSSSIWLQASVSPV